MTIRVWILILGLLMIGCREEIPLMSRDTDVRMVVEGMITDEPGPYTVRLSLTSALGESGSNPLSGCTVTISDNEGYTEALAESADGVYLTHPSGIRGVPGKEYMLAIETPDGRKYETPFERMEAPVPIDKVYSEQQYLEKEGYPFGLPGFQFYADSEVSSSDENYFLWRLTETFQYNLDYKLYAIYYDGEILVNNIDTISGYDTLFTCWKTQDVNTFYTGKTNNLAEPKIARQPLHFVGTDSKRLSVRYSLELQQYSISQDSWSFWTSMQEQISGQNFLVAKQPYNPVGNVTNVNNPDETVLGHFTVASVTRKRIFMDKPVLPFYTDSCYVGMDLENMFKTKGPAFLVIGPAGMGKIHNDCVDCRLEGGETRKPSFWIDP